MYQFIVYSSFWMKIILRKVYDFVGGLLCEVNDLHQLLRFVNKSMSHQKTIDSLFTVRLASQCLWFIATNKLYFQYIDCHKSDRIAIQMKKKKKSQAHTIIEFQRSITWDCTLELMWELNWYYSEYTKTLRRHRQSSSSIETRLCCMRSIQIRRKNLSA